MFTPDITNFHHHLIWDNLVRRYVSDNGFVDYQGFKSEEAILDQYLDLLTENPPQTNWTDEQKIAFWINAYNAFTVKLILKNYGVQSIKDIKTETQTSPWKIPFFKIGLEEFTLDKIEHEILRKQFQEPRIHFSIVCASFSCPKFRNEAFIADKLEEQLEDQTSDFINDPDKNSLNETPIGVSSLFQWYWDDFSNQFTDTQSLIYWMNKYSKTVLNSTAEIVYLPYNCALNGR
ncbi:DUF547 domain-containing protein [Pelobium sp.]|nr:DUF547 domain-containing protein [Pelobium sp.]MDA9555708.1 DUF547 domain-containing protein [Pelobium sp.]